LSLQEVTTMPMKNTTQEMIQKMHDILGEGFVTLQPVAYSLEEEFASGATIMRCELMSSDHAGGAFQIEGRGIGFVDAFFHGLMNHLASQFPSLQTIKFQDFSVRAIMATRGDGQGSDAEAEVTLSVLSSEGNEFQFTARSRSVGRASVEATLEAVTYFMNSEKAFIRIYNLLEHHRADGRADLVTKYQLLLGQMVQNTSYTEVIAQIRDTELTP
jgi:hypothetical protein